MAVRLAGTRADHVNATASFTRPVAQTDALPNYRKDIDGLRAVAVMLVLGAHFRTHVTGGYIGVDVFFVISGYLIGSAILRELAEGTFTFGSFYERRVRRIGPALLATLIATSALAYHYLFAFELVDFAKSLLAAVGSVSNFWFWHHSGYFDAPSAFMPLLHTWSLAVEEQFYLVFPVFLVLIRRLWPARLQLALWLVAATTFAFTVYCIPRGAATAFFFAPLRAWELVLGTMVSQRYFPTLRTVLARNMGSLIGLVMIVIPALLYTADTPFPGLAALPPCLGAALILAAGETGGSFVGSFLSLRPVVFVGLISYSLYLWHWPVLVFQNIGQIVAPLPQDSRLLKVELFVISLILGYLSWRFIETPFRRGRLRPAPRTLFAINGAAAALVSIVAIATLLSHGLPQRFPQAANKVAAYLDYDKRGPYREGTCFLPIRGSFSSFDQAACLSQAANSRNILIYGDSQAAQLWTGLSQVFPEIHFLQATGSDCSLDLDMPRTFPAGCRELSDFLHDDYLPKAHLGALLLGGIWGEHSIPALTRQIAWMKQRGIDVILLGPVPEYDQPLPRLVAMSLRDHEPQIVAQHLKSGGRALDEKFKGLARDRWKVPYISYFDNLCAPACPEYGAPGVPLDFDGHHFTAEGSAMFARTIRARDQLSVEGRPPRQAAR